jgi:hypothetical protein
MSVIDLTHFEELRERINARLRELRTPHANEQINRYPWLYGALGVAPADVMFICENPSLTGVASAHAATIDGRAPDIEAQWWGGPTNAAATRFRRVLCEVGLKTTPPASRGGWNCYITNVVKEANVAGAEQRRRTPGERRQQARDWADILSWEWETVRPVHVFTVGGAATQMVEMLQAERRLPRLRVEPIGHYSARGTHEAVLDAMRAPIRHRLRLG